MRRLALVLVGFAACSGDDALVIAPPALGDARSTILAATDASGLALTAASADRALRLERPGTALDLDLELLALEGDLASVGLSEGIVREAAAGTMGYQLPIATAVFTAHVHDGVATAWAPAPHLSSALTSFRAASGSSMACRPLHVESIPFASDVDYAFALDGAGARTLIGFRRTAWVLEGRTMSEVAITGINDFVPRAGGWRPGGDAFFASEDGRLAYGTLEGTLLTLRLATTSTIEPHPRFVDAGLREGGVEFYTLSLDGVLSRVDPDGSHSYPTFQPIDGAVVFGGLVRVKSGNAVAALVSDNYVFFTGDVPRSRRLSSAPTAIGFIPAIGILVATRLGEVLIERPENFEPYFDPGTSHEVTALAPLGDDGVLYVGSTGQVGYYRTATGPCIEPETVVGSQARFIVRRDGSNDWVVTGNRDPARSSVAFVTAE